LSRQLQSNPSITETVFITIQEQSSLTLTNNIPSSVLSAASASGTSGSSTPSFSSYTPGGNASVQGSATNFNLYPSGAAFPSFGNAKQLLDPASIVLSNQALFVQSTQNSVTFTSVVEAELTQ
jgi:hypothetical protein